MLTNVLQDSDFDYIDLVVMVSALDSDEDKS